jgi:hypothetical protein
VFEKWVVAQHVYWSVGRGLAAASKPSPSGDRLRTALTLADECGNQREAELVAFGVQNGAQKIRWDLANLSNSLILMVPGAAP